MRERPIIFSGDSVRAILDGMYMTLRGQPVTRDSLSVKSRCPVLRVQAARPFTVASSQRKTWPGKLQLPGLRIFWRAT